MGEICVVLMRKAHGTEVEDGSYDGKENPGMRIVMVASGLPGTIGVY